MLAATHYRPHSARHAQSTVHGCDACDVLAVGRMQMRFKQYLTLRAGSSSRRRGELLSTYMACTLMFLPRVIEHVRGSMQA